MKNNKAKKRASIRKSKTTARAVRGARLAEHGSRSTSALAGVATSGQGVLEAMLPALRGKFTTIAKLARELADGEVGRHRIGVEVGAVKSDAKKYGRGAIKLLATALGYDENTLYDYAKIVRCWTEREFKAVLKRKNKAGAPLTLSHVICISSEPSPPKRTALIDAALEQGWTVKVLKEQMNAGKPKDPAQAQVDAAQGMVVGAHDRLQKAEAWQRDVVAGLRAAGATATVVEQIGQIIEAERKLVAIHSGVLATLEVERAAIMQKLTVNGGKAKEADPPAAA